MPPTFGRAAAAQCVSEWRSNAQRGTRAAAQCARGVAAKRVVRHESGSPDAVEIVCHAAS